MRIPPLLLLAALLPSAGAAQMAAGPTPVRPVRPLLTARDSAVHLLNRLAYGATPGQVDAVLAEGITGWISRQLVAQPSQDARLVEREKAFSVLDHSASDMVGMFNDMQRERAQRARAQQGRPADSLSPPGPGGGQPPRAPPSGMAQDFRAMGAQLQQLVVVRGVLADGQLAEIMSDFWSNHFNVFYGKNLDRALLPAYIEETIRPHAMGRFEDLLLATAESPAMMIYLDNAQSVAPGSRPPEVARLDQAPRRRMRPAQAARLDSARQRLRARLPSGINENYARELMELHTLGVDGGYTQEDVVAVARILTGWSVSRPAQGARFVFNDWAHDRDAKTVLGVEFPAGQGRSEGVRLIEMLARHPATMHHVSAQLCARFVQDEPPDGCVDEAVRAWRRSDGNIREVLSAIFRSPDFWAPAAVEAKVKTPLEFVISAVRALGGDPANTPQLAQAVARLGQPLYLQSVPTGYPETQEDWVNSGALLQRMNIAMALASGRLPGVHVDLDRYLPLTADHEALLAQIDTVLLGGRMTDHTREVLRRELADITNPRDARALAVGLTLGGPEFQRQ